MSEQTPVVDAPQQPEQPAAPEASKESPAKDLRDIQALLVNGAFPGNMAPAITRAYSLLEAMAKKVEDDAAK